MPLIDALQKGVNLARSSSQGVSDAAKARYAFPMAREQWQKANTENQYLPDKMRLANEYQGLINQYYGPEHQAAIDYQKLVNQFYPDKAQADIDKTKIETQYTPLKYAIQAENAMRSNSRFGNAYKFLRSVQAMPAEQRSIWMADPDNKEHYEQQVEALRESIQNDKGNSLITPALLKRVGLTDNDIVKSATGAEAPVGVVVGHEARGHQPGTLDEIPQQPQYSQPQQTGGLMGGAPQLPGYGAYTPIPQGGLASVPPPQAQPQAPQPVQQAPQQEPVTPQAQQVAQQNNVSPEEAKPLEDDAKNPALDRKQRQLLSFQAVANKKAVGQKMWNRALGAVTFEKLLADNRDRFSRAIQNSAKYAGPTGKLKMSLDTLKREHPDDYADYVWLTQDLIPNFGMNIRVIEGLASTDSQREALNNMYKSALSWYSDPKMAIKNFNKTMDLFQGQAKSTLDTAQPAYPGVLEQLYGLKPQKGRYVVPKPSKKELEAGEGYSNDELMKIAGIK